MKIFKLLLIIFIIFPINNLKADDEVLKNKITKNLRCLICQGQSVYDSDSEFANSIKILVDQKLNEGPLINFLGKPAPTASFLAELALRMELDIIPIKFQRTSKYKSTITFLEKIKSPPNYLKHHDKVNKILEEVNSIISSWILEKPDQWFWVHRRWSKKFYKT